MLGKTADDLFRMDVSGPLPPHIALCICLANIDSKFLSDWLSSIFDYIWLIISLENTPFFSIGKPSMFSA